MNKKIRAVLDKLKKNRHIYWNIPREVGQFLNFLIRDRKYKSVLEIGTSTGYSALWIAEALSHTQGHLYTIESHQKERAKLAKETFKKSGLKNITLIEGHAPEAIPKTPKFFDLIFLDATKEEYHLYFTALKSRIKKGGMIIADNTESHKKELKKYFQAIENSKEFTNFPLKIGSGLTVSIKGFCRNSKHITL